MYAFNPTQRWIAFLDRDADTRFRNQSTKSSNEFKKEGEKKIDYFPTHSQMVYCDVCVFAKKDLLAFWIAGLWPTTLESWITVWSRVGKAGFWIWNHNRGSILIVFKLSTFAHWVVSRGTNDVQTLSLLPYRWNCFGSFVRRYLGLNIRTIFLIVDRTRGTEAHDPPGHLQPPGPPHPHLHERGPRQEAQLRHDRAHRWQDEGCLTWTTFLTTRITCSEARFLPNGKTSHLKTPLLPWCLSTA